MLAIRQHLRIFPASKPHIILILTWIFSMISLPILKWFWGDSVIPLASFTTVVLQFCAVFAVLVTAWGLKTTLIITVIVGILTWGAEAIGSKTGFPFGAYTYTELLQPQLAGVPLIIPLAWMMMLVPSWALAQVIVSHIRSKILKSLLFVVVSSLAITAWDLYLDPQMVGWGFWVWENPEGYFGIPWVNYAGWFFVSAIVTAVVMWLVRPIRLPVEPLLAIYAIVCVLQAIGLAMFWNQPGPALSGFTGMGSLLLIALKMYRSKSLNDERVDYP